MSASEQITLSSISSHHLMRSLSALIVSCLLFMPFLMSDTIRINPRKLHNDFLRLFI